MSGAVPGSPTGRAGPSAAPRRWASDPVLPLVVLAAGCVLLAAAPAWIATWAVLGGLAGYTLSGSV